MATEHAAIQDELIQYFLSAESSLGLSSSFGALLDAALGGFGGASDPERAIVRRHQVGPGGETAVTRAREVRSVLQKLQERHVNALYAAYGPTNWVRAVDDAFGRGMGERVAQRLKSAGHIGVALLTDYVARGFERDSKAEASEAPALGQVTPDCWRPSTATHLLAHKHQTIPLRWKTRANSWRTPGGWLVAQVTKGTNKSRRAEEILKDAKMLLSNAESAYLRAKGVEIAVEDLELEPRPERSRRVRKVSPVGVPIDFLSQPELGQ